MNTIIKANFFDFDIYHEQAANWELDFRLLSKNDFSAYLNMYTSPNFQLTRTKLNGKIEQFGLTPKGFRSIVIPVNVDSSFYWLNKHVEGNQLLIFPKNRTLDAISFNGFDVYVISVKESLLFNMLDNLGYYHAKKMFSGEEQYLCLTKDFASRFHQMTHLFLCEMLKNEAKLNQILSVNNHIDQILLVLFKYINGSEKQIYNEAPRKRDIAIRHAVDLIKSNEDAFYSVNQLCELTQVSERTLEYAFLQKYQVTPSNYIKANRLHKVKSELILSEKKDINISDIAGKHGFWHMGQFAKDFKRQFGKLPSELRANKYRSF